MENMRSLFIIFVICRVVNDVYAVTSNVIDICDIAKNRIYASVGTSRLISTKKTNPIFSECRLQVTSCKACLISLKLWTFYSSDDCGNLEGPISICKCDRIEITEPIHKAFARKQYCLRNGPPTNASSPHFTYDSQTQGVTILFVYSREYDQPFTIEYTAKFNIRQIEIVPDINDAITFGGTINSPFFPLQYPPDFRVQFNIKCFPKVELTCRIRLVFTDHCLASSSLLEFFETEKTRIGIVTGRLFRPPIIVSRGPELTVNFYTNKASGFGFKANYSAVLGHVEEMILKPKTACGGIVNDIGGTITMIHMTGNEDVRYDCIWIIKPHLKQSNLKTHLFIKVIDFKNMGYDSEVEIHRGFTSNHLLVQRITDSSVLTYSPNDGYVTNVNTGFYVSLQGTFKVGSRFVLSYATFSFTHSLELGTVLMSAGHHHDCYSEGDFMCHNGRCIDNYLNCDGFDHCGDNSDEFNCGYIKYLENTRSNTPNYYFPTTDTYSSVPSEFFIAFSTSFFTFLICSCICSVVYKTKQQYNYDRLQTTGEAMNPQDIFAPETAVPEEPPPEYDFPPDYNDALIYNTMKEALLHTKDVRNSAIQTDFQEYSVASCSTNIPTQLKDRSYNGNMALTVSKNSYPQISAPTLEIPLLKLTSTQVQNFRNDKNKEIILRKSSISANNLTMGLPRALRPAEKSLSRSAEMLDIKLFDRPFSPSNPKL